MLEVVFFDKTDALTENYSFYLDPINRVVRFTFAFNNFLNDVADVVRTGSGANSINGVKDKNRYVKVIEERVGLNPNFFGLIVNKILNLEYCGVSEEGFNVFYSVPNDYDYEQYSNAISYDNIYNTLLGCNKDELKELSIDQEILNSLIPCPLCEKSSGWVYNDDGDGMKMSEGYLLVSNDYESGHKSIKVDYCPKCGRKLVG